MIIGVPKEIKKDEGRVAVTPEGALAFAKAGGNCNYPQMVSCFVPLHNY